MAYPLLRLASLLIFLTLPLLVYSQCDPDSIYWSENSESGAFSTSNWEGPWNSGEALIAYDSGFAHSGTYSTKLTINTAGGNVAAVRLPVREVDVDGVWQILPDEAYYSVWYYIPAGIDREVWWNVMDWKTAYVVNGSGWSDPAYSLNFQVLDDQHYTAYLYDKMGDDGLYDSPPGVGTIAHAAVHWPADTWMNLECYYRWSTEPDGRITCWINGALAWDVDSIRTQFDVELAGYQPNVKPRQWKVNHYSDNLTPEPATIWIDDAFIAGQHGCGQANQPVAVTTALQSSIRVFPNPTQDYLRIVGDFTGPYRLMNLLGVVLLQSTEAELDLSALPTGVYVLQVGRQMHRVVKN